MPKHIPRRRRRRRRARRRRTFTIQHGPRRRLPRSPPWPAAQLAAHCPPARRRLARAAAARHAAGRRRGRPRAQPQQQIPHRGLDRRGLHAWRPKEAARARDWERRRKWCEAIRHETPCKVDCWHSANGSNAHLRMWLARAQLAHRTAMMDVTDPDTLGRHLAGWGTETPSPHECSKLMAAFAFSVTTSWKDLSSQRSIPRL